jgi:hypothetical protein
MPGLLVDNTFDPETQNSFVHAIDEGVAGGADMSMFIKVIEAEKARSRQREEEDAKARLQMAQTQNDILNMQNMMHLDAIGRDNAAKAAREEDDKARQSDLQAFRQEMESRVQFMLEQFLLSKQDLPSGTNLSTLEPSKIIDKATLDKSIGDLVSSRMTTSNTDPEKQVLLKVLDALFFRRPVEMLERFKYINVLDNFRDLPRFCVLSTSGAEGPSGPDGTDGRDGMYGGTIKPAPAITYI